MENEEKFILLGSLAHFVRPSNCELCSVLVHSFHNATGNPPVFIGKKISITVLYCIPHCMEFRATC